MQHPRKALSRINRNYKRNATTTLSAALIIANRNLLGRPLLPVVNLHR